MAPVTLESPADGIAKARAALEEHAALKALRAHPAEGQANIIFGIKVVVKND